MHLHFLVECLLPYATVRQAVYWTRQNFQQRYYLRAAMAELFQGSGLWFSPGFMKWIFYYCAPVWSTYLILLMLLGLRDGVIVGPFSSNILVMLGMGWWAGAVVFFFRDNISGAPFVDARMAKRLVPYSLWPRIERYTLLAASMPRWGAAALNVVSFFALLAFLQVLAIE